MLRGQNLDRTYRTDIGLIYHGTDLDAVGQGVAPKTQTAPDRLQNGRQSIMIKIQKAAKPMDEDHLTGILDYRLTWIRSVLDGPLEGTIQNSPGPFA